jgi:hypothetical protein
MLVTFREHPAPDLCIFHNSVIIGIGRDDASRFGRVFAISGLFTAQYEFGAALWYLKC